MSESTIAAAQTAAVGSAVLIAGVVAFQVALAAGAPLGDSVFGGKAPTRHGVLTEPFRVLAGVQSLVLLLIGWVLLSRASVVAVPLVGDRTLSWATWVIVVFLAVNTVANFAAPHPVERWVMGPLTLVLVGLGLVIAFAPPAIMLAEV